MFDMASSVISNIAYFMGSSQLNIFIIRDKQRHWTYKHSCMNIYHLYLVLQMLISQMFLLLNIQMDIPDSFQIE